MTPGAGTVIKGDNAPVASGLSGSGSIPVGSGADVYGAAASATESLQAAGHTANTGNADFSDCQDALMA